MAEAYHFGLRRFRQTGCLDCVEHHNCFLKLGGACGRIEINTAFVEHVSEDHIPMDAVLLTHQHGKGAHVRCSMSDRLRGIKRVSPMSAVRHDQGYQCYRTIEWRSSQPTDSTYRGTDWRTSRTVHRGRANTPRRFLALGFLLPNEKVEQLAANNLTIPQDAIASLLQRLVRHALIV